MNWLERWEYPIRIVRSGFVLVFAIVGYTALFGRSHGWQEWFFLVLLLPFVLTFVAVEVIEIQRTLRNQRKANTTGQPHNDNQQ